MNFELQVSNNTSLTNVQVNFKQLASFDVSNNTALTDLGYDQNHLTNLNLTKNTSLTLFSCDLCSHKPWFKQRNNQNIYIIYVTNNPNLTCINIYDVTYSNKNWTNFDAQYYFITNCSAPNSVQEMNRTISLYTNSTNENITISIKT